MNEDEYLKLQQSAETLNMSVPAFVKKKAQGSRLVAPKFDKEIDKNKNITIHTNSKNLNGITNLKSWAKNQKVLCEKCSK